MKRNAANPKLRVAIVSHIYTTGPSHVLDQYLRSRGYDVIFIGHPFLFAPELRSHYHFSRHKEASKDQYFPLVLHNETLNILKGMMLTCWWASKYGPFDLYIGVDGLNAVLGLVLRMFGRVKKVVYYTIDYIPRRYPNTVLNALYHWFDRTAVIHADMVWNLSGRMADEREKTGVSSVYRTKQIVVPIGTSGKIRPPKFSQIYRYHIAHMGHLVRRHGVDLLIKALPLIQRRLPRIHLDILGGGEEEIHLKSLAAALGIADHVTFHGYIADHDDLLRRLSFAAAGIAPYADNAESNIQNADPGKVKAYLDAGLPVIVTKVPVVWKELEQYQAGIGVSYDKKSLAQAIIWLLSDSARLRTYHANAQKLAKKYRWTKLFSEALSRVLV